ncbi:uncharacterized protein LOC134257227 [Saccostrea cucullata]|uniref:uncharacterized protein LOC134257227 n=1 Tax=Saccostrea cuccullata TaxID=36930 RepID=UPI002ED21826
MSLAASFTKVREFKVQGIHNVYHVSLGQSDTLWISDRDGDFIQTDLKGNKLKKIKTWGEDEGYHTVTQDGDLMFTDKDRKAIYTKVQDDKITEFFNTGDWEPYSIYCSHLNGDLLVGMVSDGYEEAKVSRYNKTGQELQNIQRDNKGQDIYQLPLYITENINGDICASDFNKQAVVVVNKSGQYRFISKDQGTLFCPYGICTDVLGHILVCDEIKKQWVKYPLTLCVNNENNIYVGQRYSDTDSVQMSLPPLEIKTPPPLEIKIPGTAQHFLECGFEDCERNCEFYCNSCHQQMCKSCRDQHLKIPENKNHEVVLYQQRRRQLPMKKCRIHFTKEMDILCQECNIPICSKCSTMQEHSTLKKDLHREIQKDVAEVKQIMDSIRTSMKAEAESLKNMVDTVLLENMEELHRKEKSLLKKLRRQKKTFDDYIAYLSDLVKEFQSYLSSTELTNFTTKLPDNLQIKSIPETTKPVTPEFSSAQYNKNDIAKLLGKLIKSDKRAELRRVKPMEIHPIATSMKSTSEQTKQDKHVKSDKKQTLSLSASVTKVREFYVPDLQGNVIQKIETSGRRGYHTVTQDRDLTFTDKDKKAINRITQDNNITEFIKTGDWTPVSIHSSHINGDLLVGMWTSGKAKVTRYNKTGKELQNIQRDNKGEELFSYTGQKSKFEPYGICTDVLGHILVCDGHYNSNTVHLLNQDGQILSLLLTPQQGVDRPRAVCVDDENNLYVGQKDTNTLTVYKYLQ